MNEVELYNYMQNKAKKTNELFQVEIDVTSRCNACCPFCFQGEHLAQDDELSFDSMIVLLDKLREMGTYYIGFSGGEPFIREDLNHKLRPTKRYLHRKAKNRDRGRVFSVRLEPFPVV